MAETVPWLHYDAFTQLPGSTVEVRYFHEMNDFGIRSTILGSLTLEILYF